MAESTLNRFQRVVAIYIHLQSGKTVTAAELAERFEVSMRTIYRDLRTLEACGIPLCGEPGKGYCLVEGFNQPAVALLPPEAHSLVAAGALLQKYGGSAVSAHFQSALFKLRAGLRQQLRDRLAKLEAQVLINANEVPFMQDDGASLAVLLEALATQTQVVMRYQAISNPEPSNRIVEPLELYHEHNRWYLVAWCHLRKDYRHFRTDRILQISPTDKPHQVQHNRAHLANIRQPQGERVEVVLRVDEKTVPYLEFGREHYGFCREWRGDDGVYMAFLTDARYEDLARWYMMFADHADIVSPSWYREKAIALHRRIQMRIEGEVPAEEQVNLRG